MDQQAMGSKPRSYTEDYKRQVVDLVASSGRTATAVAAEVGLHPTLLCRWVRQYGAGGGEVEAARLPLLRLSCCLFPQPTRRPRSRDCGGNATGCAWSGTF